MAEETPKPSWWNDEQHGKWDSSMAGVFGAFEEVLGRSVAPQEAGNFAGLARGYKNSGDEGFRKWLSITPEARMRGVDPGAHGNTVVDPATLSEKDREWHDAWAEANPGETFYDGILDELHWKQPLYSVDVYRGMNDGSITTDRNGIITVTPQAIETYGEDRLLFWHGNGQSIRVPEGSNLWIQEQQEYAYEKPDNWKQEDWDAWLGQQNSDGYTLVNTRPEQKKGLGDYIAGGLEDIGLGSDAVDFVMAAVPVAAAFTGPAAWGVAGATATAPLAAPFAENALGIDEAYFATDPLGATSGIHWGTEGMRRNLEGAESVLGSNAGRIQGVGQAVVGTAASLVTGGLAGVGLAAGWSMLSNANRAAAGQQSWGDAFANAGIGAAASALSFGATAGMESGVATAFANAGIQGASSALQSGIATGDWDAALEQGAVAALSSAATSGFTNAMGTQSMLMGAMQGAAVGGGASYLSGAALGLEGDDLDWSMYSGMATGALSGGAGAAQRRDYYNKIDPKTRMTGYDFSRTRRVDSGRGPLPPDASAWDRTRRWGTNWNVGGLRYGGAIAEGAQNAWDFATPWETRRETGQRVRGWSDSPWGSPRNWMENRERLPAFVNDPAQFDVAEQAVGPLR